MKVLVKICILLDLRKDLRLLQRNVASNVDVCINLPKTMPTIRLHIRYDSMRFDSIWFGLGIVNGIGSVADCNVCQGKHFAIA